MEKPIEIFTLSQIFFPDAFVGYFNTITKTKQNKINSDRNMKKDAPGPVICGLQMSSCSVMLCQIPLLSQGRDFPSSALPALQWSILSGWIHVGSTSLIALQVAGLSSRFFFVQHNVWLRIAAKCIEFWDKLSTRIIRRWRENHGHVGCRSLCFQGKSFLPLANLNNVFQLYQHQDE